MSRKQNLNIERGLGRLARTLEQHQLVNSCMLVTHLKHPNESLTELLFRFNWARRHMLIMGKKFEDYLEFQVYR